VQSDSEAESSLSEEEEVVSPSKTTPRQKAAAAQMVKAEEPSPAKKVSVQWPSLVSGCCTVKSRVDDSSLLLLLLCRGSNIFHLAPVPLRCYHCLSVSITRSPHYDYSPIYPWRNG
jgi:hypothetical protein